MQVKFKNKENKEITLSLEEEEVHFFVEFAIVELLKRGTLTIQDDPTEEQLQLDFLQKLDVAQLPGA